MKIFICIDDTDNYESKGTGSIADEIKQLIEDNAWGRCSFTTRHQLLLHEDVPYTSHNSSMCFEADIQKEYYEILVEKATEYLRKESVKEADPGICVAIIEKIKDKEKLIEYGFKAKRQIITKEEAYNLADELGIFLSEQGGTGGGIIGALAGVGLRISGNDGELKGGVLEFEKDKKYEVSEILEHNRIDEVCTIDSLKLNKNDKVTISWKAKPVLNNGKLVLLARKDKKTNEWITLNKKEIRKFGDENVYKIACDYFSFDVEEERISDVEKSCLNCKYRKWTEDSFLCIENKI